jgi:Ni,Fe-hydrogenase maturation factor
LLFVAEVVRHQHAARARSLLLSMPEPEAWAPLVAALEAIEHENPDVLQALSPEMRAAAELALSRIAPDFMGEPQTAHSPLPTAAARSGVSST